ncbi:hypothetical protein [Tomitella gaofuii]|uniref:hypothetical protein n=1 Tax=Tomitella gaofuii TaxID=2760083 RepID=UPI0015FB4C79|nr:hypothetical protein [Tomitella gaofuii]
MATSAHRAGQARDILAAAVDLGYDAKSLKPATDVLDRAEVVSATAGSFVAEDQAAEIIAQIVAGKLSPGAGAAQLADAPRPDEQAERVRAGLDAAVAELETQGIVRLSGAVGDGIARWLDAQVRTAAEEVVGHAGAIAGMDAAKAIKSQGTRAAYAAVADAYDVVQACWSLARDMRVAGVAGSGQRGAVAEQFQFAHPERLRPGAPGADRVGQFAADVASGAQPAVNRVPAPLPDGGRVSLPA